jgi:2-polyprenyl-3-methyl-5-hydroxy-6-metoxy-1,4-benzoquinol methylase
MTVCPCCSNYEIKRHCNYEITVPQAGQDFHLDRCKKCQLVFTSPKPQPELLACLYSDDKYYSYQKFYISKEVQPTGLVKKIKRWLKMAVIDHYYGYGQRKIGFKSNLWLKLLGGLVKGLVKDDIVHNARIMPYIKSGTHLDIGCGSGGFVHWMSEKGWDSAGLELNPSAVEIACQLNLNVKQSEIESAGFADEQFDLITAWEVLEHVSDLKRFLKEVRRTMKLGGKFVGSVPNIASMEATFFGRDWQPLEIPYHLYHFSPVSLRAVFKQAGFRLEKLEFLKITHSWDASLGKKYPQGIWFMPILQLIGRPFYLLSNKLGRGARLKFVVVKQN